MVRSELGKVMRDLIIRVLALLILIAVCDVILGVMLLAVDWFNRTQELQSLSMVHPVA